MTAGPSAANALSTHEALIANETLATAIDLNDGAPAGAVSESKLQDEPITIGLERA